MSAACDVSVIIPIFNRTTSLKKALQSVKNQTLRPTEVIVVDDCSSPELAREIKAIVLEYADDLNVKLIVNEQNQGANFSRNRAICVATAKYLAFLDSDDLWMPDKLATQMSLIKVARAADVRPVLSGTGRYRVSGLGVMLALQFGGKRFSAARIKKSNFIGTLSSVVVETRIARHIGGFDVNLQACQDWDFFIRLSEHVQYVGVEDMLTVYVDHDEDRITLNNKKRLRSHLYIHRLHQRRSDPPVNKFAMYRSIAEDFQELGQHRMAAKFYVKSLSFSRFRSPAMRNFSLIYWSCYYRWTGLPHIKRERYDRYRIGMAKLKKDPERAEKLSVDATTILKLITLG